MRVSVNLNAQKPDTTTNAVIYARYSSHGQTEQSIEGQLAKGMSTRQRKDIPSYTNTSTVP